MDRRAADGEDSESSRNTRSLAWRVVCVLFFSSFKTAYPDALSQSRNVQHQGQWVPSEGWITLDIEQPCLVPVERSVLITVIGWSYWRLIHCRNSIPNPIRLRNIRREVKSTELKAFSRSKKTTNPLLGTVVSSSVRLKTLLIMPVVFLGMEPVWLEDIINWEQW